MRYISWAVFYEGVTDGLYLDVLIPRMIRDLIAFGGGADICEVPEFPAVRLGRQGRSVAQVAAEACAFRDAYDIVFVHADTGGRGIERGLADRADAYCTAFAERCDWPVARCITIMPRHETEAWLLTDGVAITEALGYRGDPAEVGLPPDARAAERLVDPKQALRQAVERITGRRRSQSVDTLFPAIAQRQRLATLRQSASFAQFEARLHECLTVMGYMR